MPEDWEVKKIIDVAPLQRGFDLPTHCIRRGSIPVIYSNGICNYHNKGICKAPGLVTGRSGTIGKFTFIADGMYWPHNTSLWVTTFKDNEPKYIFYLYSSLDFASYSSGSGVPTLNRNDVHDTYVSLPPISEQHKIAEALSDMDTLIAELEKLIAKKRLIKQGAMQQLLTGRTRLKGFNESWKTLKLSDCLTIGNGRDYSHLSFGSVPVFGTGGIMCYVNESLYNGETVCIGRKGTIDHPLYHKGKIWTVDTLFYTHSFINCQPKYIYYLFLTIDWYALNEATGVPSLQKTNIYNLEVSIPSLQEQRAISSILTDMDNEIAELEKKKSKYEKLKQGMMQQLLTGRIRLI